jgi:hypothetical protein
MQEQEERREEQEILQGLRHGVLAPLYDSLNGEVLTPKGKGLQFSPALIFSGRMSLNRLTP